MKNSKFYKIIEEIISFLLFLLIAFFLVFLSSLGIVKNFEETNFLFGLSVYFLVVSIWIVVLVLDTAWDKYYRNEYFKQLLNY
jgi:hypothetical protein